MSAEVWRDISGYEGYYQVSNFGRVRRVGKALIKPQNNGNGYLTVGLSKNGRVKKAFIHRLVAQAFVDNPNGCNVVNHLDEDRTNNKADNLEWTTLTDNFKYGSAQRRARANWNASRESHINNRRVLIRCVELDRVFCGIVDAKQALNIKGYNISSCIHGRRKRAYGYHWELVE